MEDLIDREKEVEVPPLPKITQVDDYEKLVGAQVVDKIRKKARALQHLHVVNVNSTYYGGGVAELLTSLTLLMNSVGIKTGWRVLQGAPDFFSITKKMHNALPGEEIDLSRRKKEIYEAIVYENAIRNHLESHNMVIIHDPQPLLLINHYKKNGPWIWRCHIELINPYGELWDYLVPCIEKYDAVILSIQEYRRTLKAPQIFFLPAIDPFSIKNREMSAEEIAERLAHYEIPTDLPLIVQVSRFDRWKDPQGVIRAFKIARKEVKATLVLLGNVATDDPEGAKVYESLLDSREERIIVLSRQDTALVNALSAEKEMIQSRFRRTLADLDWPGQYLGTGQARKGICL